MGTCSFRKRKYNCYICGNQFQGANQVQIQQHILTCSARVQNYVQPNQNPNPENPVIQNLPQQLFQPIVVVGSVPGQAVMDDFYNNGIQKHFWCKELIAGSKTQYHWVRKPIPPLPEQSIQAFLLIPWATIKGSEFTTKQTWFRLNLEKLRVPWQQGSDSVHVSKESFLMSTLGAVHGINWHREVKVIIAGEEKVLDAGGLLREWVNLTMKEIIHPESGIFQLAETDDVTYKINSQADPDEHVLDCFRLLGIVVGKAIFERVPLNAFLDRTIIRHMLGQTVLIDDIFYYDIQLYQSWTFLMNNTFDPQELMEYFVIFRKSLGDTYELITKGSDVMVDNENKHDYVRLCIDYYTFASIKPFIQAFLNQLYAIVPKKYLSIFDPIELEMILYGIPFINLEDWKENTEYKGGYYRGHQTIIWFWQVLGNLDQPMLAKFLQFCTGSQRTPVEGFRKLESNRGNCAKFCVESVAYTRANPYPKAHTCFNRLELPIYESQEDVETYLKAIVDNDLDGVFGME